MLDQMIRSR